jgi:hypothetical protein
MEEEEQQPENEETVENLGVKIVGGFFTFRANPKVSKPISELENEPGESNSLDFGQKGEITGMVLIKKYGTRTFMGYTPIDPTKFSIDKFMTNFADTSLDNKFDNNQTQVLDIDTLDILIKKFILNGTA